MPCFCPQCSKSPLPTYTEAHRAQCEANYIAALSTDAQRLRYLQLVRQERGVKATTALRRAAWTVMQNRSANHTTPTAT